MKSRDTVVLSADVFGYTRLVNDYESETLERLVLYHRIFRKYINRAGGRIFNYAGDAVLAEFPKVDSALVAAVKIQQQIRRQNLKCPLGQQMLFRMGINSGKVFERGTDLLGDTINIAARLQAVAEPGGICVSQAIYLGMSQGLSISVDDVGMQSLKNIPASIQAYTLSFNQGSLPRRLVVPTGPGFIKNHPKTLLACFIALVFARVIVYSSATMDHPRTDTTISVPQSAVVMEPVVRSDNAISAELSEAAPAATLTVPSTPSRSDGKKAATLTKPGTETADPVKAGLFVGSLLFGGLAALSAIDDMKHGSSGNHKPQSAATASSEMITSPNKDPESLPDLVPLSPEAQSSPISRCKMTIAGQIDFNSGCEYSVTPRYMTFEAPSINGRFRYLAKINLNPDRTGDGFLSSGATKQERSLGTMTRHGACWLNGDETVELCAWK